MFSARSIVRPSSVRHFSPLSARLFSSSAARFVSVGDKLPSTPLYEGSPGNDVDLALETEQTLSVIIGVPGAFSPACLASHVPGFLKRLREFNDKGYKSFYVVGVNDPFVMKAWGETLLARNLGTNQVRFLADSRGEFSEQLDVLFDATKVFGNKRSKRYVLLADDGKVTQAFVEPDNTSVDVSAAENVLKNA